MFYKMKVSFPWKQKNKWRQLLNRQMKNFVKFYHGDAI